MATWFTQVRFSISEIGLEKWAPGYNYFNNLITLTRWWLHNEILRHVYKKKVFSFFIRFLPVWLQSLKKVLIWPKLIFLKSRKTKNFTLTSNPFQRFLKNVQKKVISKNVMKICTFSTFTHVRQTCFAYNFIWVHFLKTFSSDLKSAWNSAFFYTFFRSY